MRFVPIALLVLANALWGSSYVVAKVALEEIPPAILASLRFGLAAAVLWLIIGARGGVRLPSRTDTLRLLALGVLGIAMNGVLGYTGVNLTTATDASLLIVGEVLFTTLLAVAVVGERLDRWRGSGLLIGLAGVLILIGGGVSNPVEGAPARGLGDVLILTGLAFEAAHTVLGTRLSVRYQPLTVLTLTLTGSCLVWLPLLGWSAANGELRMPSPRAAAGVLYLALVTGVACYLVWFGVLRRAGAMLGALSLMAQPVVGVALGIWLLGDPVTLSTVVGTVCVMTCLFVASGGLRALRIVGNVGGQRTENHFHLKRCQAGVLRAQPRHEARDVRRGEAVARRVQPRPVAPRHADVDARRTELHRWPRIVVEQLRIFARARRHGDYRGVQRRVGRDRQVVGRRYEDDVLEVRQVRQLVQCGVQVSLRGTQTEIAHVYLMVKRPTEPGGKDGAESPQTRPEHFDAEQLTLGCELADDSRTRSAMSDGVSVWTGVVPDLVAIERDRHVAAEVGANRRMRRLDTTVDDGYSDTAAGAATPRPVACESVESVDRRHVLERVRAERRGVRGLRGCHWRWIQACRAFSRART